MEQVDEGGERGSRRRIKGERDREKERNAGMGNEGEER